MQRRTVITAALAALAAAFTLGAATAQTPAAKPLKLTLNFLAGGPQAHPNVMLSDDLWLWHLRQLEDLGAADARHQHGAHQDAFLSDDVHRRA